jgi:hypothetical protein
MSKLMNSAYEYTAEGALGASAEPYVKRKADDVLYEALLAGQYCYVLNTRQMGKSSLRVRVAAQLREKGVICAEVDLSIVGSKQATQEQWYESVLRRLVRSLRLTASFNLRAWWLEHAHLTPSERFSEFLESVVLKKFDQPVVIFFDEIDSTLNFSFGSDEFFTIIRACYNERAHQPDLKRLTFAMLGVADPSDLIQDKTRTPFNIGRAIELRGFTLEEAEPLSLGLSKTAERPIEVLRAILEWTSGQPFLTHKICKLVNDESTPIPAGEEEAYVARIIQQRIIENWDTHDEPEHLKTISNRIQWSPKRRTARLLVTYRKILEDKQLKADNSPEEMELRLTGLVVNERGWLRVYNRIYAAVFNEQWVEASLARLRPYSESLLAWNASGCNDDSRLLRGAALRDAQVWAEGKSLGDADWRFLAASQELDRQEIEKALVQEREAFRLQREAQARLEKVLESEKTAKQKVEAVLEAERTAKSKLEGALEKEQEATQTLTRARNVAAKKAAQARWTVGLTFVAVLLLLGIGVAVAYSLVAKARTSERQAADARQKAESAIQTSESARRLAETQAAEAEKRKAEAEKSTLEARRFQEDLKKDRERTASINQKLTAQAQKAQSEAKRARVEADQQKAIATQTVADANDTTVRLTAKYDELVAKCKDSSKN